MSGIYSGVQARTAAREPMAVYVHCASHNLNLIRNDAVKIQEVRKFYETAECICVFFGHSMKRWAMPSNMLTTQSDSNTKPVTLKRLCPTRWSSCNDAVTALGYRYTNVLKALTIISLKSKTTDEVDEAFSLKHAIEKFSFICLLILQNKILERTNVMSKLL